MGIEKVAFLSINPKNRYSGGRIHALWLAYAFAANGYEVDYYTNCTPVFWKDIPSKYRNRIHFIINKFFLWHPLCTEYKHIIVVPHLASWKKELVDKVLFYPFVRRLKIKCGCPMWYLDFESPNWIYKTDPTLRPMSCYRNSNTILKDCDVILSTTNTGKEYAKDYYAKYNSNLKFFQLYLAINIDAAKDFDYTKKSNKAMFFARFGQKHKGNEAILSIIQSLPDGFQFVILGNRDAAEPSFLDRLEKLCYSKSIGLSFLKNISDYEKFKLLAETKIVFFSSKFEGYGIPPLEAQYMGASVICSDLPVLREVNPMATFIDFDNPIQLKSAVKELLANPKEPKELRKCVEGIASPEKFYANLGTILKTEIK